MMQSREGLQGLKPHAEATIFQEWRVTPELKERLHARIEAVKRDGRAARTRRAPGGRWLNLSIAAAVAVAALGVGIKMGQQQEVRLAGEVAASAPLASSSDAYDRGNAPSIMDQSGNPAVGKVLDANGNTVSYSMVTLSAAASPDLASGAAQKFTVAGAPATLTAAKDVSSADGTFGATSGATFGPVARGVEVEPGRKIILNADYQLQVKDAPAVAQQLQKLAVAQGGYIVEANVTQGGDGSYSGRLVLRIPAAAYGEATLQIRQFGDVKQERQWSQDVTAQYADLQARIAIQQEMEQKLEALALKAATFDDWMKLTQQINNNRAQIEQMQGQLKLLANQTDYSTITVGLNQPGPRAVEQKGAPATVGQQMGTSFAGSVAWLAAAGKALLVAVAAITPFLLPAGAVALLVWLAVRRRRARQRQVE